MAILAIVNGKGWTQETYDALRPVLNWESQHPAGLILHCAAFDEQGGHVVDLWDSAEHFDVFSKTRLGPAMQQLGFPPPDSVTVMPAHNVNAFVGIERYRI